MSNFNLMATLGPLMKDLVMGKSISDILKKVFTPEMQGGIALKLHEIVEQKLVEHNASFAVFAVVPVPVTNNGKPIFDNNGKECFHLRIKLIEIINENGKSSYGRVLMNLSINELINELQRITENN